MFLLNTHSLQNWFHQISPASRQYHTDKNLFFSNSTVWTGHIVNPIFLAHVHIFFRFGETAEMSARMAHREIPFFNSPIKTIKFAV